MWCCTWTTRHTFVTESFSWPSLDTSGTDYLHPRRSAIPRTHYPLLDRLTRQAEPNSGRGFYNRPWIAQLALPKIFLHWMQVLSIYARENTLCADYLVVIEPAEMKADMPLDISHVPLCTVLYFHSLSLRCTAMAVYVIRVMERTARAWGETFVSTLEYYLFSDGQASVLGFHLRNALYTVYTYADRPALAPLRLAFATFLDSISPVINRQPRSVGLYDTREWHVFARMITADIYRSRQHRGASRWLDDSVIQEAEIERIWSHAEANGGLQNPMPLEMMHLPSLQDLQ